MAHRSGSCDLVTSGGFGYLLKDRVLEVADFLSATERVAGGGSALDPHLVGVESEDGRRRVLAVLAYLGAARG